MAGPQRRAAVLALAMGGFLSVSGCDGAPEPSHASPTTPTVSPTVPREPLTQRETDPTTSAEACGSEPFEAEVFDAEAVLAYTPNGPAYDGPGPHSVELLRRMGTDDEYGPTLPTQWAYPRPTELVVCEYEDLSGSRQVGTCEYLGGDALGGTSRVNSARFTYRVFEGRTGALVKKFTLRGTTTPEETCPDTSYYPDGALYYQQVENKDLVARIRPLVEDDR